MKPVQSFSDEYLERSSQMSPEEISRFLEQFRLVHGGIGAAKQKTKLISLKVPENLLNAFRQKSELEGVRYQTQIKQLMAEWLD
jgi:predicted DNA binding CopG/RHH family protein